VITQRAATWLDSPHYGQRGPHNRRLCLECGEELSETRKRFTFCGDACRAAREVKCHPGSARWQVFARDHGICARCGFDCAALDEALKEFGFTYPHYDDGWMKERGYQSELAKEWLREQGFRESFWGKWKSTWETHHRTAVVEGGGGCELDGLETLCYRCHRAETADLARRRADARRGRVPLAWWATRREE